jgi:undecaprenyl-diphosphatase
MGACLERNHTIAVLDYATLVHGDLIVESWIRERTTPTGLAVFGWITQLGSPAVSAVIVLVAIYLWHRRQFLLLWNWLGANLGAKAIEYVLKGTVHRSRPVYNTVVYTSSDSYSFPSGHTMGATVCYFLLAYLIATRSTTALQVRIAYGTACVIIAAVGWSRLYLGVHYPSDVLGGLCAGLAWLSACGVTRRFVAARLRLRNKRVMSKSQAQ